MDMTSEVLATKAKINKAGFYKLKRFCTSKEIIHSEKAAPRTEDYLQTMYLIRG